MTLLVAGALALAAIIGGLMILAYALGGKVAVARQSRQEIDAVAVSNTVEDQVAKMSDEEVMKEEAKWSR